MNHRFFGRYLISFLFISTMFLPVAYSQTQDAGLWTSFGFETGIYKRLSVSISEEFRFNENVTELGTWINEAGLEYKFNKYLKASVNYRFTQKRQLNNFYSPRHRVYIDVKAEKKFKPLIVKFRTRLQEEYADIHRAEDGGFAGYYSRNKFTFEFDFDKKWQPYISAELFSPLCQDKPAFIDDIRVAAGFEYAVTKHHKIDLYYMIQRELYVNDPVTDYIAGIGYLFKL